MPYYRESGQASNREDGMLKEKAPPKKTRKQELAELINWPESDELQRLVESGFPSGVARVLGVSLTNLRAYCSKFKIKIPENRYFFKLGERLPQEAPELVTVRHPRDKADSIERRSGLRTSVYENVIELIEYCKMGDLFAVEDWIAKGYPVQFVPDENFRWGNRRSPLRIALNSGNRSLCELLLINGYDPNISGEFYSGTLISSKRLDLVHLILDFGYDWKRFDGPDVLRTYDDRLIRRFLVLGMDPFEKDDLAYVLSSGVIAPIARYVKEWKIQCPEDVVKQLTIALLGGIREENLPLVRSMLSLGADPYMEVLDSSSGYSYEGNAIRAAVWSSEFAFWKVLKVDYSRIDVPELISSSIHSGNAEVHKALLKHAKLGDISSEEATKIIDSSISSLAWIEEYGGRGWGRYQKSDEPKVLKELREFIARGHKWESLQSTEIAYLRKELRRCSSKVAATIVAMFDQMDVMDPTALKELCRTPAIKKTFVPSFCIRRDIKSDGGREAKARPTNKGGGGVNEGHRFANRLPIQSYFDAFWPIYAHFQNA